MKIFATLRTEHDGSDKESFILSYRDLDDPLILTTDKIDNRHDFLGKIHEIIEEDKESERVNSGD